jgi:hypothetical protein
MLRPFNSAAICNTSPAHRLFIRLSGEANRRQRFAEIRQRVKADVVTTRGVAIFL